MGVLDKFLNVMRLNPDDEDDFYDDDFYEEEEEEERKSFFRKKSDEEDDIFDDKSTKEKTSKTTPKLTPIRGGKKAGQNMEVCVIKPTSVDDAREITETLLENRTVVLNVEGLDVDIAQRIIDFASGSCFAISGNLQKISNYIFIITPPNVDVSGDFLNLMDAFDTSAIQTDF
ncbi:MAG: cell division protein SepF [Lachnospiraceae bacterium]|nr:cell division protein SepF [Lachnospiraceae bacterium]MDD7377808.1 cell division protein SepF [Lachnospiraceae bacterium]MDY4616131.1 cell division protein SepF [Lachnospiraceae bacterium]